MRNNFNIILYGDSILNKCYETLETSITYKYHGKNIQVLNMCTNGDTSHDALKRIDIIQPSYPDKIFINLGMNDALSKGFYTVKLEEYQSNITKIIENLLEKTNQLYLLNLYPSTSNLNAEANHVINDYNSILLNLSKKFKIRYINLNKLWRETFIKPTDGLIDNIHPNKRGIELIVKTLILNSQRDHYIVLWYYNGNPCACNYKCPYCTYTAQRGHHFTRTIEEWHESFKNTFGNNNLTFYFGHGEPMLGKQFYNVLDMIAGEKQWEGRMISNISLPLDRLINSKLVKDGRFYVNASFHPHMVAKEEFLKQLLVLRKNGIETPVVYTMYPPLFKRFENDFKFFDKYNFMVHVRRFRGYYDGKLYPEAYTDAELQYIAKYCDNQTIKSMLFDEPSYLRETWTGVDFFAIDNKGNVGYCDDARPENTSFGNILDNTFALPQSYPIKFPIKYSSDGTVDGVANFIDTNYDQLNGNHISDFSKNGDVFYYNERIIYGNMFTNFNDSKIRAEYHFPARTIQDVIEILKQNEPFNKKIKRIKYSANKSIYNCSNNYSILNKIIRKYKR